MAVGVTAGFSGDQTDPLAEPVIERVPIGVRNKLAAYQGQTIIPALPKTAAAFNTKYAGANPTTFGLDSTDTVLFETLKGIDKRRAVAGTNPLNDTQTRKALSAAKKKQMTTPEPDRSIWSIKDNIVNDLQDVVKSVPRLPAALWREAQRIPNIGKEIAATKDIAGLTRLPIVDLIPGAYTAGNILSGPKGWKEAATHPLMTALDVAPEVKALAAGTEVAKFAENAAGITERVNPVSTVLTKKLVDGPQGPELVRTTLGNVTQAAADSRVGQMWDQNFGQHIRRVSKIVNLRTNELTDMITTDKPILDSQSNMEEVIKVAREGNGTLYEGVSKKYGISPERSQEIALAMEHAPDRIFEPRADNNAPRFPSRALPDNEQAYVAKILDNRAVLDKYMESEGMLLRFGEELYRPEDHAKLISIQKQMMDRNHGYIDRGDKLFAKYLPYKAYGFRNLTEFVQNLQKGSSYGGRDWSTYRQEIPPEILPLFDAHVAYMDHVTPENLMAVKIATNQLAKGRTRIGASGHTGPIGESGVTTLSEFQNFRQEIGKLQKANKKMEAMDTIFPARFQPKMSENAAQNYISYRFGDRTDLMEEALALHQKGLLSRMEGYSATRTRDPLTGQSVKGLYDFLNEEAGTWIKMRDAGFDPLYQHRMSISAAEQLAYPKIGVTDFDPAQTKARMMDMSSSVDDAMVTIHGEAVELLKHDITNKLIEDVSNHVSFTRADVEAMYMRQAERLNEIHPNASVAEHLRELISKKYEPYEPGTAFFTSKPETLSGAQLTDRLILKSEAKTLRQMFTRDTYSFGPVIDPLTGAMRTSLLALSPRWHVYNILGGGMMLQARSTFGVWSTLPDAWKAVSSMMNGSGGSLKAMGLPDDLIRTLGGMQRDAAEIEFRAGGTMKKLYHDAVFGKDSPESLAAMGVRQEPGIAKAAFENIRKKSYELNQRFDDMYRVMAYLDGFDESITKGMTRAQAIEMGLHKATKVLQDMTELTPFENGILRKVFPFYNFYQHIMRYLVSYPIDHPLRVSITAALARNEIAALGGLPHGMLEALFLGEPDKNGEQQSISLAGMNPFSSSASLFTLAGWLGSTNPIAKTVAEQLGLDTRSGEPALYPQLGYDPSTGSMSIKTENPMLQMLYNTVPQTQIIGELLGTQDEFNRLRKTNPEAANRMLASQAGLPIINRTFNPGEKRMTSELARQKSLGIEVDDLTKVGDIHTLATNPRYAEAYAALAAAQQDGTLQDMVPAVYSTSLTKSLTGAIGNQVGYTAITPQEKQAYRKQLISSRQTPGNSSIIY
jgi:hypothetical protein